MVNNRWRYHPTNQGFRPFKRYTFGLCDTDCTPKTHSYLQKIYHIRVSPVCLLSPYFAGCYTRRRESCDQQAKELRYAASPFSRKEIASLAGFIFERKVRRHFVLA